MFSELVFVGETSGAKQLERTIHQEPTYYRRSLSSTLYLMGSIQQT